MIWVQQNHIQLSNILAATISAIVLMVGLLPTAAFSQNEKKVARVATYECPPFVIEEAGEYSGLSIFLIDEIAKQLDVEYSLEKYELQPLLDAVANHEVIAGASCLSITQEREKVIDFSHSYYETHLAIAVKHRDLFARIKGLLTNSKLLIGIGIVCLAAMVIGGVIYFLEHKRNDKLYSGSTTGGKLIETFVIGLLFVTHGPIKYYEFKSFTARMLSAALAVGSTLFIASITAVLASAFTVDYLKTQITGPHDLVNMDVGAKEASTSSSYLLRNDIPYKGYATNRDMLMDLNDGVINAVVADAAILKYMIKQGTESGVYQDLAVLPYQFEKQNYAFAFADDNPNIEVINQTLLNVRNTDAWNQKLLEYFNE